MSDGLKGRMTNDPLLAASHLCRCTFKVHLGRSVKSSRSNRRRAGTYRPSFLPASGRASRQAAAEVREDDLWNKRCGAKRGEPLFFLPLGARGPLAVISKTRQPEKIGSSRGKSAELGGSRGNSKSPKTYVLQLIACTPPFIPQGLSLSNGLVLILFVFPIPPCAPPTQFSAFRFQLSAFPQPPLRVLRASARAFTTSPCGSCAELLRVRPSALRFSPSHPALPPTHFSFPLSALSFSPRVPASLRETPPHFKTVAYEHFHSCFARRRPRRSSL